MQYDFFNNDFVNVTPNNTEPFVVGTDITLSFSEVYQRFNDLKKCFNELAYEKNSPVIIYGEKQANYAVCIITFLHLNIPYVAVDSIMPEHRVKVIQETTQSKVLINLSDISLDSVNTPIVFDQELRLTKNTEPVNNIDVDLSIENLAYILFTSGSTGVPKGVQITRKALNNFIKWFVNWPIQSKDLVYMNQATFSFDVYLCDLVSAFHYGSLLVLNDLQTLKTPELFLQRFKTYQATTLFCTPSFISMYLTLPEFNQTNYPHFKHITLLGEDLPAALVRKIRKAFPDLKIINSYGPTEATVVVTYVEVTEEILSLDKAVPIGYVKPDTEILIDNESKNPTEEGELIIVGDNVSIGYSNRTDLNSEKYFIHNGKRAYRTGDLAYYKGDLVYFNGRMDSQVKLNGYRIELDEISNLLLKHTNVSNAATIPLKVGNTVKKIVTYISVKNSSDFDANDILKNYLKELVPVYMIPSEIIVLPELPTNSNYKTDKKALLDLYINR